MTTRKRNAVPLIIEEHPTDYDGYPFITLIQYGTKHVLTIVDNSTDKQIRAVVLDLCGPEKINEEKIVTIAAEWYDENRDNYPLSIEFSRRGMVEEFARLIRTYNKDFVTRVIGPLPCYPMTETKSVRRRKRKTLPHGLRVHHRQLFEAS